MKKIISIFAAVSALALAATFVSCGDSGDEYNGATDTVVSLSTPSVSAKAFPGYILVTWDPVPNVSSQGYEVYRYENGKLTDYTVKKVTSKTYLEDTDDLQNGVKYTYKVIARGSIVASRSVETSDSKAGSASATAIVPPLATSALNLAAYEGGYSGKEKTLSSSETKNYLLSADSTDLASNLGNLGVAIRAKAYLNYEVYLDAGDKYAVTNALLSSEKATLAGGKNSTIVNNSVLPMTAAVTTAGEYAVYVKAKAKSPYFVNADVVKVGTVTYDVLEALNNPTITTAAYVDAGATIRVTFNGVSFANGKASTASNFLVYRTDDTASGYTAVTGIKETETGANKYYDIVVLTDGTKYGKAAASKEVSAYAKNAFTVSNDPSGSATALDTDAIKNDITWTIKLDDADTTFKAYLLTKEATYTGTPVAADFDTTTALTAVAGDDTTGKSWTIYSKDVVASTGKAYLLVIYSKDGYKDTYKVSDVVDVDVNAIDKPTLSVSKYDNTVTGATTATPTINDVIINVSDTITVASDSISNYTYTLYRTTSTVKTDFTAGTFTWQADTKDWEKVTDLTMNSNTAYDTAATTVDYVAVYTAANVADGAYAYKVVKTNKTTNASATSTIQYVTITATDDANKIVFTPSITAAWDDSSLTTSKVTVKFIKDNTTHTAITETHDSTENIVGYKSESEETGVTYTIWRATLAASSAETEVVYTKIGTVTSKTNTNSSEMTVSVWNATSESWTTKADYTYVDSITYSYEDTSLSTGNGYSYIVVGSKTGVADVVSASASVYGSN